MTCCAHCLCDVTRDQHGAWRLAWGGGADPYACEDSGDGHSPLDPDAWREDFADAARGAIVPEAARSRMPSGDAAALRALGPLIRPLTAEEAEERRRAYSGPGGHLTREAIMRALLGEFSC